MRKSINTENNNDRRYIILGLNIAYYRKLKNLTQMDLSEMTNLSRTYISNIEAPNSACSFSLETLFSIAEALEVEPYMLLLEHGKMNSD